MFISVILGAMAVAFIGYYLPDTLSVLFDWGDVVADEIYHLELIGPEIRNIIRFLITGPQMVFLAFVIIARIVMSLIGAAFSLARG